MPIFNKIRKTLIPAEGLQRYLFYAIGEMLLVVLGILIALQIDNWNDARKSKEVEMGYLKNLKRDLEATITELDEFIANRKEIVSSADSIVASYEGRPVRDWNRFNKQLVTVYSWERFFQIDHTFQEMRSSGNLSIISNPDIKKGLLELDQSYKKMKFSEDHLRYDCEQCLFEPSYNTQDIRKMADDFHFQVSGGKGGHQENLSAADFKGLLKDQKQKNGFVFVGMYMGGMNSSSGKIIGKCRQLIDLIDADLKEK